MSIGALNSVSSITNYSPSQPYNPSTPTQASPQNIYGSDTVSLLARSANETSIFVAGGVSGYKYHGTLGEVGSGLLTSIKSGSPSQMVGAVTDGFKNMGQTTLNGAGVGALIGGGTALVTGTIGVLRGRDVVDATRDVAVMTMKGAIGGAGGVFGGGLFASAAKLVGLAGTPAIIAGVVGGVVGAAVANNAFGGVTDRIRNAF